MDDRIRRPNPFRWVAYAFGARLPDRNRRWVLHDVTTRTWVLRHLLRTTVQLIPLLALLFLVVPGPAWVRLGAIASGAVIGYFYSMVYVVEACETRVMKAGYPVGAFYMYEFAGIWQLGEEEAARKWANAVPGDPRYADLNGNGVFDEGDKTYVGNPNPKLFGGMDNSITYGNFSLSVFLNFSAGNKVYNTARNLFSRSVPFVQNFAEVNDFWTPTNPSNAVPRPSQGGNTTTLATMVSTRFLEDADFIRVKNVSLTYNLPPQLLSGVALQRAQVMISGTNLLTFTKYTGLDPEASSRSSLLSSGIDYTPYPLTRMFTLSVKANF